MKKDENYYKEIVRLSKLKDLKLVVSDDFYREHFVQRYVNNLNLMAFEVFNVSLTYQQNDVLSSHNYIGGSTIVSSGHGTGKTFLIGFLALSFLLFNNHSIVRIQAPKIMQILKYSFKEITSLINSLKYGYSEDEQILMSEWSFLTKHIIITKTLIYVRGYQTSWYIEPATAPKGEPDKLSGQHSYFYLLIFDEASGIEDSHISASLGGLTQKINSFFAFSQNTSTFGFFNEAVENTSGKNNVHILSSRKSPLVTKEAILGWEDRYTPDEIRVRVDGLQPKRDKGLLISDDTVKNGYTNTKVFNDDEMITLVFSLDFGFSGLRDNNIITTSKVKLKEDNSRITQIDDILKGETEISSNGQSKSISCTRFVETVGIKYILRKLDNYYEKGIVANCVIIADGTSGGSSAVEKLEELLLDIDYDIELINCRWGAIECLIKTR